jgi:hypothetical protein
MFRVLLLAAGIMVLPSPTSGTLALACNLIGLAAGALVALVEVLRFKRARQLERLPAEGAARRV